MPLTRTCGPRICHVSDVQAEDIPLIEHPGFAEHHYSSLVRRDGMFPANCQLFWSPEAMKRYSIWSVDFTKEDCVKGLKNCGLLWVHDKSDHFFPLFTPKPMAQGGSSPGNVVWTHGNSYASNDNFRRLLQFMDEAGLAYDPPLPKPLNSAQLPDLSGLYEVVGIATPKPSRITGLPSNHRTSVRYVDLPHDVVADSKGVYGYVPTSDSQFHSSKWPVDWTDADQVSDARNTRLKYHVDLDRKQAFVASLRREGASEDEIAKRIVEMRNQDRLSHYKTPEALAVVYQRNLAKYGNKTGPSYESQIAKYGNPTAVIDAALRTNDTMDVLTGIAKPK